ncbi:MAG: hypothetical protein K8I00_04705 [Candidatus Omnitrophica bacterium]|nr:hypothetical protein [Candidatus Omnitrophota bacterium]
MSDRRRSSAYGAGVFGETHCRKIYEYIQENFRVVKTFGEQDVPGNSAHRPYRAQIYQRKAK